MLFLPSVFLNVNKAVTIGHNSSRHRQLDMSRQSPSQPGTSPSALRQLVVTNATASGATTAAPGPTTTGSSISSSSASSARPSSSSTSTLPGASGPTSSSAFRVVGSSGRSMTPTNLLASAGGNALVPLVEAVPLEIRAAGALLNQPGNSSRVSTEMVNACGRGSSGNLQSLGSAATQAGAGANVTTSTSTAASVTGIMTLGNGTTSAFTSQHSAGGEFFYFDDDLRDFSSAGDSAAPPVPAAADLIASDVDVESIERLLERLRRSDIAHGQRQHRQGSVGGVAEMAAAVTILRQNDLSGKQNQNVQKMPTGTLALFGVCGQSKSDSCLAASRSSPDTYGLLSGSTGGTGGAGATGTGDSTRDLAMSWPLNDSAIVFRQYPLFADDTALLTSSIANSKGLKSATVASGLTHLQAQGSRKFAVQSQPSNPVMTSATGSMTFNSELMDVLSRKHNYRLTFANHGGQQQAVGRSGMLVDSLASERSHLSRGSAADFGDSLLIVGNNPSSTSAAAKAALLKKLQDDLNARCVNITYEKIKNQLFGNQQQQQQVGSNNRELVAIENVDATFQPIDRAPATAVPPKVPMKPTTTRSRNTSENCATPATDNNSAEDQAQPIVNSLHIDSSDLDDDYGESAKVDKQDVSKELSQINKVSERRRTSSAEVRSFSMPLSSQVNDGATRAIRCHSANSIGVVEPDNLQFAWPVPKMIDTPVTGRRMSRRRQSSTDERRSKQPSLSPTKMPRAAVDEEEDDDENGSTTRYHSPSPAKTISSAKPSPPVVIRNQRSISASPTSQSTSLCSSSTSMNSCCDNRQHNLHHPHNHNHNLSHHSHGSRNHSVPSCRLQHQQCPSCDSPMLPPSGVVPSPGASSYATVASQQHQRSKNHAQIMAANFIPPSSTPASSSAHHTSPLPCQQLNTQQQNSCLCLTFAQIWHSVLANHAAAAAAGTSTLNPNNNNNNNTLKLMPSSAAGSPPHHHLLQKPANRHHQHKHHKCRRHHHHRHSDVVAGEEIRTIGTQFPLPYSDCATQTPPMMGSPTMTVRSAITTATRHSSAEKSPDISHGPVAVIFDPQSHSEAPAAATASPPDTAGSSPPVVKSYFFTFRSLPNVNFLRSPVDTRRSKNWQVQENKELDEEAFVDRNVVPEEDEAESKTNERDRIKQQLRVASQATMFVKHHVTMPPPPPRPPRNRHKRIVGSNSSPGSGHQHSSGDSGASLASYSVDTTSLSRSPRFIGEEESGIGGIHQHSNPAGVVMEQCGRRLLLLPQNGANAKAAKDSSAAESPQQQQQQQPLQSPVFKTTATVTRQLQHPCIAEEQPSSNTALLSATVDLQSPSSALLHNRVTSSPEAANKQANKDLFPRNQPSTGSNAFIYNDDVTTNHVLRREEEQAKERVRSLGNAVDEILHLFEPSTAASAPTATNAFNAKRASLHYVVYSALCPSLVHLLNHGFTGDAKGGSTGVSLFTAVVEIITSGEVSEQSVTLVCQVAEMRVADSDDKKLLALFVGLLNLRWLPQWLCELYQNQDGVRKFYSEQSLLAAATSGCRALFWAAVQSLRPLSTLDLQLSLTSILNHHDVSSGAFPAISSTAVTANAPVKPPASPAPKTAPTIRKQQQQRQQVTPPKDKLQNHVQNKKAKQVKVTLQPKPVSTSPVAPIANTDEIVMDDIVASKKATSSSSTSSSPIKRSSGIPSAPSTSGATCKPLTSGGNIPKPVQIAQRKAVRNQESPETTVEKAQPVVTVTNSTSSSTGSSLLRGKSGTAENRRGANGTAPSSLPTGHPPSAPSSTPLSGNRVRLPSSTPIFQRGNSTESKRSGVPTSAANATERRSTASPASLGGSRVRSHTLTGETALNNITASSSSSSASPASRRRPLASGIARK